MIAQERTKRLQIDKVEDGISQLRDLIRTVDMSAEWMKLDPQTCKQAEELKRTINGLDSSVTEFRRALQATCENPPSSGVISTLRPKPGMIIQCDRFAIGERQTFRDESFIAIKNSESDFESRRLGHKSDWKFSAAVDPTRSDKSFVVLSDFGSSLAGSGILCREVASDGSHIENGEVIYVGHELIDSHFGPLKVIGNAKTN